MSNKGKMRVQGVQCPRCDQKIWSKHRHDYHHCGCGYSSVDGGRDYLRYGWGVKVDKPNDGSITEAEWADINAQNQKIGKPKIIYMYVPRPRQLTQEEIAERNNRLYSLLLMDYIQKDKRDELSKPRDRKQVDNKKKRGGSRKTPNPISKRSTVRNSRSKRSN